MEATEAQKRYIGSLLFKNRIFFDYGQADSITPHNDVGFLREFSRRLGRDLNKREASKLIGELKDNTKNLSWDRLVRIV